MKLSNKILSAVAFVFAIGAAFASPTQDFVNLNGQVLAIPEQVDCSVLQQVTCTFNGLPIYETQQGAEFEIPTDIVKRAM